MDDSLNDYKYAPEFLHRKHELINILLVFFIFLYKNYKSTRLQRNLQAYYYKATNYFTTSHMLANYRQWDYKPWFWRSREVDSIFLSIVTFLPSTLVYIGKIMDNRLLTTYFLHCSSLQRCTINSYDSYWRLTWSLTSGPGGLVEVRANWPGHSR